MLRRYSLYSGGEFKIKRLQKMGKQKKTRKFAEVKRLLNPKDLE